jgi:multicomponent Na+:H+ antiporter subunit F
MTIPLIIIVSTLGFGAALSCVMLFVFKKTAERVVVVDGLTTLITGFLVVLSFILHTPFILDIALIYAVLAFAAVFVFARYLEGGV